MDDKPIFDAARFKTTTRAQWEAAAGAWRDWGPFLGRWLGPATEAMLDLAQVGPGQHVLDVAAGAGEQSFSAARCVGPTGQVLATDIAPSLLAHAAADAQAAGLHWLRTQELDGEALDTLPAESFDVVISRVGLIYFPDRARALAGMRHVLKPGGRVGAIVYSTPERNPFFSIPVSIIRRRAKLPPPLPGQPGPFSLGGEGVLAAAFERAGFGQIKVRPVPSPLRLPSAAECVRFERESFGALHQMMAGLDEREREEAWAEVHAELAKFETADGFVGPCEMLVGVATKEAA
ncbi:MAG: methyltransferase domain-containing protein [Methylibium sp.]|uniref:class I SAM-dependent methyltransferase n=1 Tax=Methylibium sp. TaxID=2067992 RepID=UPI0018377D23|nr:methyltransferase domain-containing protein [Methylibium sp.]MBA3596969.1 methyltransferase domain-containing protein [Methylibium sp.]